MQANKDKYQKINYIHSDICVSTGLMIRDLKH